METERVLPHDVEAERMVLGAVLVDNAALLTAREILRASDFYREPHRRIWQAYCDCQDAGEAIEPTVLAARLRSQQQLEAVGGLAYLGSLTDGLPRISNPGDWCALILDAARRREAIHQAAQLAQRAYDPGEALATTLDTHQAALLRLIDSRGASCDVTMSEALRQATERLDRYAYSRGMVGVPSGIPSLDAMCSGWQPGQLIVVAARPRCGKSSLCAQMAVVAARAGFAVRAFPLEMSPAAVAERMLLSAAETDRPRRVGCDDAWARVGRAVGELQELPITFDRRSAPLVTDIVATCRRQRRHGGLRLVIVDYLQRVAYDPRLEERIGVGGIVRALKSMARDIDVPVIVAAQLSRIAEKEVPTLGALAKSGDIESEADVVLALQAEPDVDPDLPFLPTRMLMLKNREGGTRRINLSFERRLTRLVEVEPEAEGQQPQQRKLEAVAEVPK